MKVLHLLHSFPPASHGGTETYVLALAKAQRAAGDDAVIVAGSESPAIAQAREESIEGVPVSRLPPPARDPYPLDGLDPAARTAIERILRDGGFDIAHVHHWHNLTADAVAIAAAAGVRAVVSLHDLLVTCPLFFRLPDHRDLCPPDLPRAVCVACVDRFISSREWVDQQLRRREAHFRSELLGAATVITLSEAQRAFLARIPWLADVPMHTLPLPAPAVPVPQRPFRGSRPGALRLVSWGGLVPGKGLHTVVQACERLRAPERVSLDHFGRAIDTVYRDGLVGTARRMRLTLHGGYDAARMAEAFADHDLAVFPSLFLETHGFAVDEAMALGLPVLVADRGAPQHRVAGRGRVAPAGDVAAWAALLQDLIDRPEELRALRAGAPAQAPAMPEHLAALRAIYRAARASSR